MGVGVGTHRRYVETRRGVIEIGMRVVHCQTQIKVAFLTAFFCTALTVLGINKIFP